MIRLEFSSAVALYLFFSVIVILTLWVFFGHRSYKDKYKSGDKFVWHCTICDYTFIDSVREDISQCPRCGSFVERGSANKGEVV